MQSAAEFLLTLGGILMLGLVTSTLGRRSLLPRVTLLLVFGAIIGKQVLDVIPPGFFEYFDIVADMALENILVPGWAANSAVPTR